MINANESNKFDTSVGANRPVSVEKLKEYGKKAYGPLINVVYKYQDEFTPYLNALSRGLEAGAQDLSKENSSESERYVSHFFREAADGLREATRKLESKDVNEFSSYLNRLADTKPSIMFSTSYIAGLFFGRLGRHIVGHQKQPGNEPPAFDQSIH